MSALERLRELSSACGPRVVTSAHQAATAAGAAAFAAGGNAFDAALAACLMESIALPMKCGLGGDVVALYRRANGPFEALISVGPGPKALDRGEFLERVGPRSVGIPGAPDGYTRLHSFARLKLERLAAPAIAAAETGMVWTRVALNYLVQSEPLLRRWSPDCSYLSESSKPSIGGIRKLPGLAGLLRQFVQDGPELFARQGGEQLLAELRDKGGILTEEDLHVRPAFTVPAAQYSLPNGTALNVTPSPTSGPRLASLIRQRLSSARSLLTLVREEREAAKQAGRQPADGGTSVVTAADDEGNAVIVVHSNSFPQFGSGIVLSSGLVLNNRPGRGFDLSAESGARNAPRAGRTPPTTLHAWALEQDEGVFLGATPGGVNQLPWNAQSLMELVGGSSLAAAVTSPRWGLSEDDQLTAEPGADIPAGANEKIAPALSLGSAQQLLHLSAGQLIEAAADPRNGACALAVY